MAARWRVEACSVNDAEAVARNTGGAFWEEPMWTLQWTPNVTQDFLTEQLIKLQPIRLLRDRTSLRHQKAVDFASGKLVGYARWRMPEGGRSSTSTTATDSEPEPDWAEAQISDVSVDERKELDAIAAGAWWDPRTDVDELDVDIPVVRQRVVGERPFLELELLAVHPDNKGKGIATSLVESGIQQAEKMRVPILAICYKGVRGVYRRLGFVEADCIIKDDSAYGGRGEYCWYFMLYEVPKKTV